MAEAKSSTARRDRGRPQLRPDDETRQIIYEAARHEFAAAGYAATSTETVARRAGVSTKTLYRLVPNKAALFEAMMQSHASSLPVPTLPDVPGDPQTEITAWCAGLLAHMRQWRSLIRKSFGRATQGFSYPATLLLSPYAKRLPALSLVWLPTSRK